MGDTDSEQERKARQEQQARQDQQDREDRKNTVSRTSTFHSMFDMPRSFPTKDSSHIGAYPSTSSYEYGSRGGTRRNKSRRGKTNRRRGKTNRRRSKTNRRRRKH